MQNGDSSARYPLEAGLLTAAQHLTWQRSRNDKVPSRLPEDVILTHQASLFRSLAPRFRTKRLPGLSADVRMLPGSKGRQAVVYVGVGGPATAVAVELTLLGVRRVVAVDIAASIDPRLRSGMSIIATAALMADGTARHYTEGDQVEASVGLRGRTKALLREAGLSFEEVPVVSTDAPYRETQTLVESWRAQGACAVDMETAALYATSAALGIEAMALLVIADELFDGWRPPSDYAVVQAELKGLARISKPS